MNTQAKMSTKGQMVVPAEVRQALGFKPGDVLDIVVDKDSMVVRRLQSIKKGKLIDLIGSVPCRGPAKTIEEINQGIHDAIAKRMKRELGRK